MVTIRMKIFGTRSMCLIFSSLIDLSILWLMLILNRKDILNIFRRVSGNVNIPISVEEDAKSMNRMSNICYVLMTSFWKIIWLFRTRLKLKTIDNHSKYRSINVQINYRKMDVLVMRKSNKWYLNWFSLSILSKGSCILGKR